MKTKKSRLFAGILVLAMALALLLSGASPARAITMADLLGGLDVVIGDKSFENFRNYVSVGTNGAYAVSPSEISVSFSITPAGLYQVDYQSGIMTVGQNQLQDTRFTYDVRVITGQPLLNGNGVTLLSYGLGGSNAAADLGKLSVSATVTDAGGGALAYEMVQDDHGGIVWSASAWWASPVNKLIVASDIALSGDNVSGGGAFISDFTQTFSQTAVPEPATMLLLGFGLLGLTGIRRKIQK